MMNFEARPFYESIIAAGAILSGFCGAFLAFRIQREANYYRQPSVEKGEDVFVGLTHFSSSFLLLILGTCCSVVFGFLAPLLGLAGVAWILANPRIVTAGLVGSLVLIAGYFVDELVHYEIVSVSLRPRYDKAGWRRELPVVIGSAIGALLLALVTFLTVRPGG